MGKHLRKYAKGYVATGIAVLTAVKSVIGDGITADEWIYIGLAFLTALGVVTVENKDEDDADDNADAAV